MNLENFLHYEILGKLGAGGMGEVYRARDSKLGREVAIKVLPAEVAHDAESLARFQREAQVLASLNHPNVAAIFGLEESGGERYLILELVPGKTLAEHIKAQHALPLEEALPIARQIAEALEAAHEKGIIHRDLKPANIKITPDGKVKVLDFGLAKDVTAVARSGDESQSPTISVAATRAGMILGTAGYMSPEQARGKPLDKRTDIWSFGCVLFEMLAGKMSFAGETVSDTIASILTAEPDWSSLPAGIPRRIENLLRRCLEKNPMRRLRDIGDARIEIEDATATRPGQEAPTAQPASPVTEKRRASWPTIAACSAVAAIIALLAGFWLAGSRKPAPTGWKGQMLGGATASMGPRISPDGKTLAFQAMVDNLTQVAVMNPRSGNWTVLTHDRTRGFVLDLSWSHDGSKIYFDRWVGAKGIYSIPPLGGETRLVLEDAASPEPLPDGSLLVARVDPDRRLRIYRFWPETGKLRAYNAWPELEVGSDFRVFPDGKEAVFFGTAEGFETDPSSHLFVLDLATGRSRRLAPNVAVTRTAESLPLAATENAVITDLPSGNVHQLISIPRTGRGPITKLNALTVAPWGLDVGPDGTLYMDQVERPLELLRFPPSGGRPEVLASSELYTSIFIQQSVELPDGRMLLPSSHMGRSRVLVVKPGGEPLPLVDTQEETSGPYCLAGEKEVALLIGSVPNQSIALVSVADGRIVRRLKGVNPTGMVALAASPDGNTLYYSLNREVWKIPASDGTPVKIHAGDSVTPDPNGRDLIIKLNEPAAARLIRVPVEGGKEVTIPTHSEGYRLLGASIPVSATAAARDGRILVTLTSTDSWFLQSGVLNPASGDLTRIPLDFTGDVSSSGWSRDGQVLALSEILRANIWSFQPVK